MDWSSILSGINYAIGAAGNTASAVIIGEKLEKYKKEVKEILSKQTSIQSALNKLQEINNRYDSRLNSAMSYLAKNIMRKERNRNQEEISKYRKASSNLDAEKDALANDLSYTIMHPIASKASEVMENFKYGTKGPADQSPDNPDITTS